LQAVLLAVVGAAAKATILPALEIAPAL
jgi:hypothetical protein